MNKPVIAVAALAAIAAAAHAQNYTLHNLTPAGYLEGFFLGAGGQYAVGYGDFPNLDIPIPDARYVHAFVWDQAAQAMTDLDPNNEFSGSFAIGAGGGQQVGYAFIGGGNFAMLWSGTAASAVRLDTVGTISTVARGTDGSRQVGYAITTQSGGDSRAMIWHGTAASGRQLAMPDSFNSSTANVIRAGRIVGTGEDQDYFQAGLYWADEKSDAQVIRPDGFEETRLSDVSGDWVLGSGYGEPTNYQRHAFLWNVNDTENGIDLHPTDSVYTFSEANAMTGASARFATGVQVGVVAYENDSFQFVEHAAVWFGSSDSFIDLHAMVVASLGAEFQWSSATGVDEYGNIYGTAHDGQGNFRSVQWAVPAPGVATLGLAALTLGARRRR